MKKGITFLVFAILAGVVAFCLMRSHKLADPKEALLDKTPELTWLRNDLKLTDEQFAKVSELHAGYRPKCVDMCHRISEAHEKIEALVRSDHKVTPELEAAVREHALVHAEGQKAMLEHLYRTAAVLDEKQAARYLDTMLPYALDFSHSEPESQHAR